MVQMILTLGETEEQKIEQLKRLSNAKSKQNVILNLLSALTTEKLQEFDDSITKTYEETEVIYIQETQQAILNQCFITHRELQHF